MTESDEESAPVRARRRARPAVPDVVGAVIISSVVLAAIGAAWLAPYSPLETDLLGRLKPPMWTSETGAVHVLGTDEVGRDIADA